MKRSSGILLHIISLPGRFGIGDLGHEARGFADFLERAGQSIWQILPVNQPLATHTSPYHSISAFAGDSLLISPELLVEEGLLARDALSSAPPFSGGPIDYGAVASYKESLLHEAFMCFRAGGSAADYEDFCSEHASWLDDFALFKALKRSFHGKVWSSWPADLRDRQESALLAAREAHEHVVEEEKFRQYIFFRQWEELKRYCHHNGITVMGDMAIYVEYDSADVWKNPAMFKLDAKKLPAFVSGVPPDYFSSTGQLWGHPVYDWDAAREQGYRWWLDRIRHNLKLYDCLRIDHFRGLLAYWEVGAGEKTALGGTWVKAPSEEFFTLLQSAFPEMPFVAEDLGVITPDVTAAMDRFGFPGMRVLVFAFAEDDPAHPYLPHNYVPECVAYTGTHDTETVRGWFEKESSPEEREGLCRYLGRSVSPETVSWEMVRLASASVARRVVFPMQDLLGLGSEARMNRPGTSAGNYHWRLGMGQADMRLERSLRELTGTYGRLPAREEAE